MRQLRSRAGLGLAAPTTATVPGTSYSVALPTLTQSDVINALPDSMRGTYASVSASYTQNTLAQQGGSAAASLVTHGFNPNNQQDVANLVHVYAAAISFVPGVGPILGGITEAMYALGQALAQWPPFQQLVGMCTDPRGCCQSSGNWTYAQGLSLSGIATPAPGTFAALMVPQLVDAWVHAMNCDRGNFWFQAYGVMLPVLSGMWNRIAGGPSIDYFVPLLNAPDLGQELGIGPGQSVVPAGPVWAAAEGYPSGIGNGGPLVFASQGPYAFWPLSEVPASAKVNSITGQSMEGRSWTRISANAGPLFQSAIDAAIAVARAAEGRTGGTLLTPAALAAAQGPSAGTKVVLGTAAAAGAAVAGSVIFSFVKGKAWDYVLGKAWEKTKALF